MPHFFSHPRQLSGLRPALLAVLVVLGLAPPVEAQNEALMRLLQVLRDRGSISAQEYDEIRKVAESPQSPATTKQPVGDLEQRVAAQETAVAAIKAQTDGNPPPIVGRALAGKWYERIGLRGYTQFRIADVLSQEEGPALEVPSDRSVNDNESFIIRRGRFVFSGDISDRLSLYAQSDFNASTGAADFSLQMRDLYADVWLDKAKFFRVRAGQSKVPFGWSNMQSSQNRAPLERPDAINSAAEGERDIGAALMWTPAGPRQLFRDITARGLKGAGDYGVLAVGLYGGQGPNRSDQNGQPHVVGRVAYPFKLTTGQFLELGVQAYHGRFVSPTQAFSVSGASITPTQEAEGALDQRVGFTAVWYPQPVGIETEWTIGRGPELSADGTRIESDSLLGGYVQLNYRTQRGSGTWFPFARWNYFDGGRKFARNAPRSIVNEVDLGLEFARWAEVELTGMFTHTFKRTRTGSFPYASSLDANRIGVQLQWNY